ALACLQELEATGGVAYMARIGTELRTGMERQAATHGLAIRYTGPPAIPFVTFAADEGSFERSRTFAAAGASHVGSLHPHAYCFRSPPLADTDVARVLEVTDEAFRAAARV